MTSSFNELVSNNSPLLLTTVIVVRYFYDCLCVVFCRVGDGGLRRRFGRRGFRRRLLGRPQNTSIRRTFHRVFDRLKRTVCVRRNLNGGRARRKLRRLRVAAVAAETVRL